MVNDAVETNELSNQIDFEMALVEGTRVEVRWTNSFRYYRAIATVVRVNRSSVRVTVTEAHPVAGAGAYLIGRTLSFPRLTSRTWSRQNGVFAVQVSS